MAHSAQKRAEIRRQRAEIARAAEEAAADEDRRFELPREKLRLTSEPEPPTPCRFHWTVLADYLDPRWADLWTPRLRGEADRQEHLKLGPGHGPSRYVHVPPPAQRLFIGLASRTEPKLRTGDVKVTLTAGDAARIQYPGSRHDPHRRRKPMETGSKALVARDLVKSYHIAGDRTWRLDADPVSWDVRFPPGSWGKGPRVLLDPLEGIRAHGGWRLMLAALRLWWRPRVTFDHRPRGGTWKDCPASAWPTVEEVVAAAWPDAYATSKGAARVQRHRALQEIARLARNGLVRIVGGRVLPGEVRIADYDPVTLATNPVTLATNPVTLATNPVTPDT